MRIGGAIPAALLAVLWAAGTVPAAAAPPDLATCPKVSEEPDETGRTRPLPVPAPLRAIMKSKMTHFAVSTLDGSTLCLETMGMGSTGPITLSADGRFVSFGWLGYESYGHKLVDRTGKGQVIETGVAPTFSPSRRYLAAADQTESEFGSLTGLAVWEAGPKGTEEIGRIGEVKGMNNLRIEGWVGESCIDLTGTEQDVVPEVLDQTPRVRFRAGPGKDGWHVSRSAQGCRTR